MVIPLFMKMPAGAALRERKWFTSSCRSCQEGMLISFCQVVSYILSTYATDDIIAEVDADIINYKQPKDLHAVDYSQALWTEALRRGRVYEEYRLKGTSIEGLR